MKNKVIIYPYIIWMIIFIIIPILLLFYFSILSDNTNNLENRYTLEHFIRVFEPIYLSVIIHSIKLAIICTIICFFLGYPIAYILAKSNYDKISFILFLFIVPMWMNFLLRTYAWLNILESNGLINKTLELFKLPKYNFLYTDGSVILGLVYNFLPFMILPIYTSLHKIDKGIIESAQDLGANSINVFFKIVLPLTIPGILSGITMVFMPSITTFIVSNILGGGQYMLIGNLIEQQFLRVFNHNFGSALSIILMIFIFVISILISLLDKYYEENN